MASVASPVTDHVNGNFEYIYLDLCLALSSMMRMLSKYVRTYVHIAHAHSDVALGNHTSRRQDFCSRGGADVDPSALLALRRLSEARDCIQRTLALPR